MSNSSLVNYVRISPHKTVPRNTKIDSIALHHMAGNLSVETLGRVFQEREASTHYGIASDGRIGMYVEEKDCAWSLGNRDWNMRTINIELANDEIGGNWHVSDRVIERCIDLCVDICRRNNISKLVFTGNVNGNLIQHRYIAATVCPGPYLASRFDYIANEVNKRLGTTPSPTKTIEELAREVIAGNWGNGEERKNRLEAAGYNYNDVQNRVNEILLTPTKSNEALAQEVWQGLWGNGQERYNRLTEAGYDYQAVMDIVNGKTIHVGSKVVVTNPIDYYGRKLNVSGIYDVIEVSGNRIVIGKGTAVTAAIPLQNIRLA